MNIQLTKTQSDTREGDIEVQAAGNYAGKAGLLMKLINDSGVTQAELPGSVSDLAFYVLLASGNVGEYCIIEQPRQTNFRIYAYGNGGPGDILILANPTANSGAQAGMVSSLTGSEAPVTPGLYFSPGVAEVAFNNGDLVRIAPLPRMVRVTSPLNSFVDDTTGTAPAAVSGVVTIPAVTSVATAANAIAAILAQLNAMRTAGEAQGEIT